MERIAGMRECVPWKSLLPRCHAHRRKESVWDVFYRMFVDVHCTVQYFSILTLNSASSQSGGGGGTDSMNFISSINGDYHGRGWNFF